MRRTYPFEAVAEVHYAMLDDPEARRLMLEMLGEVSREADLRGPRGGRYVAVAPPDRFDAGPMDERGRVRIAGRFIARYARPRR